ncbi:DoxX family protein [Pseudoruegeria sp. HB172150]|uniref:DoxX family protein n=1 Tax=Pseudoruegeria sp. HB172150 TaxID=2721164 RepID=UPI0015560C2B|nr:DoxX family protein [Pseudoruegeria sp. HB172150]
MQLAGWIILGLFAVFMVAASAAPKLMGIEAANGSFEQIGWPLNYVLMIGLMELAFTVLVLVPRTSLLGGILMTGLLGGAVASQLRAGSPMVTHTLFGIYLGVFMWVGIILRQPRLLDAILGR